MAEGEPREADRGIGADVDSGLPQPFQKLRLETAGAEGVVDDPDLHAGPGPADQDVADRAPDPVVADDVVGDRDGAACSLQGRDQGGIGVRSVVQQFDPVVFPARCAAAAADQPVQREAVVRIGLGAGQGAGFLTDQQVDQQARRGAECRQQPPRREPYGVAVAVGEPGQGEQGDRQVKHRNPVHDPVSWHTLCQNAGCGGRTVRRSGKKGIRRRNIWKIVFSFLPLHKQNECGVLTLNGLEFFIFSV